MQIGFVGLGKMGGNMVTRIRRDAPEHEVVAFDFDAAAVTHVEQTGAHGAGSLKELVVRSRHRARCGSWCPPGTRRSRRSTRSRSCSSPAT